MITYSIGPKLGDFINGLIVPRFVYETTGTKARILLTGEGCTFTKGIQKTFEELKPILTKQEFVAEFDLVGREHIDFELFTFRQSRDLFRTGWTELYFNKYLPQEEIPEDYQWLFLPVTMNDNVLMNRTLREMSPKTLKKYEEFVDRYKVKFICSDIEQFKGFPLAHKVELLHVQTLEDMCKEIAACKLFIGNQSSPLAIASAFGKDRIAELRRGPDALHYAAEKYSSNLQTFVGD